MCCSNGVGVTSDTKDSCKLNRGLAKETGDAGNAPGVAWLYCAFQVSTEVLLWPKEL